VRRELSTPSTFVYRWVIPGLLTLASILVVWRFTRIGLPGEPETMQVIAGVAIAVFLMVLARYFDGGKRVWLDSDALIVSAYGKDVRIPLHDIDTVDATRYVRPDRVRIRFRRATKWGMSIVFFPPLRLEGWADPHPVVTELAQQATGADACCH